MPDADRPASNPALDPSAQPEGARGAALTTMVDAAPAASSDLQLVILGPDDHFAKRDLPASGSVTIGRGWGVDLDLPDRSVSRQHARLHIGAGGAFVLEDLGSVNGSQVGATRLASGSRARVELGEVMFLGRTIGFVQRSSAESRRVPLTSVGQLEQRLIEIFAAGPDDPDGQEATLLLVELLDGTLAERLGEVTAAEVGEGDLCVAYGGGQFGALMVGGPPGSAAQRASALLVALRRLGRGLGIGAAKLWEDGRTPEELLDRARQRLEVACRAVDPDEQLIFSDPRMRRLYQLARHAAEGFINVLILGETGVGKDVLARALHRFSPRGQRIFQRVECAALTEALAESELFGHARGAFTDAHKDKPGLIEAADGGTVFLDEVGELPPKLQAKLLHVLETRRITRVGAVESRPVDVRFIAATNRDLEIEANRGTFRRDLYYRLCGFTIAVPPLRERRDDVLPLARALVRQSCVRLARPSVPALSPETQALLESYDWPGNVRELRNAVERAVLVCQGARLNPEHFELRERRMPVAPVQAAVASQDVAPLPAAAVAGEAAERRRIVEALAACGGNQSRAAKMLGMARSTLVLRLEAFGITRPRKQP